MSTEPSPCRPGKKIFNDCVHGTIEMPAAAVAIIDTPQFQRLRRIKQLGTVHLVYPSATNNRFQHSLGVAHLAAALASSLRKEESRKKCYDISDKDVLCVMLAGLCHDLGHGPMSHLWETFVHMANDNDLDEGMDEASVVESGDNGMERRRAFRHEDLSILMLDYLLKENDIDLTSLVAGFNDKDLIFVKELIAGQLDDELLLGRRESESGWSFRGRGPEKAFLYDIVANKRNGIDVDKLDYFCRDSHFLNIPQGCLYDRYIAFAKVVSVKEGECFVKRISMRDKERPLLDDVLDTRRKLHQRAYQHRVCKITERMMLDAWLLADPVLVLKAEDGKSYRLSTAHANLSLYTSLTDDYVDFLIRHSADSRLVPAKAVLKRIDCRDLYECLITVDLQEDRFVGVCHRSVLDIERDVITFNPKLKLSDIAVIRRRINKGAKLKNTLFHNKDGNPVAIEGDSGHKEHEDDVVNHELLLCVKSRERSALALDAFKAWVNSFMSTVT